MALDLTAGAPPIFLTKNYFNKDAYTYGGTFSVSSNTGLGPRVYDMDPFAYWLSSGSTDAVTETITSQLYEGYSLADRTVHLFAMLNTNAKNFLVEYSIDGGVTWTTVVSVTGNTAQDYYYDLSASPLLLVDAWRVSIYTTFAIVDSATGSTRAAGGEKQVGTICVNGLLWQTTQPPETLRRTYYDSVKVVTLADRSEDITYFKRSPASHEFYGCEMRFVNLPDADRDKLRFIRRLYPIFCLAPEPGDRKGDLFCGRFLGDWTDEPSDEYKAAGNTVAIAFKETTS